MRLGGPVFSPEATPGEWVEGLRRSGYRAAYCPGAVIRRPDDAALIRDFAEAAAKADLVLAEVGAWSNPLSPDAAERERALKLCQARLDLADRLGARCCVNIAGSRGQKWDGPHPLNLAPETFDLIVQTVRQIIDAVQPKCACYTIETMPWILPDSADSYLALIKAMDRPAFAVHLDPVNLVNCPARYYDTAGLLRDCFAKLGPWIKSCHAKDILLRQDLTVHLEEVRPGKGGLDYAVFLRELSKLPADTPLMLEHLPNAEEYQQAAGHIRSVAQAAGVAL